MSGNPFEAPSAAGGTTAPSAYDDGTDVHVTLAMAWLFVVGLVISLFGVLLLLTGVMFGVVGSLDPTFQTNPDDPPPIVMAFIAFFESLFFFIPGVVYLLAGFGVLKRKTWGWVLAMLGFSLTFAGCCAPFGVYGFYALIRESPRRAFGL